MKRILIFSLACCAIPAFAFAPDLTCGQALPSSHPGFCQSFASVASCHCIGMGLPRSMCQDMTQIYNRMIGMFGSQQRACQYQHDTSYQICMDDWNCYRLGGRDSQGKLCSSSGNHC